jgi:hypothetical protein
MNILKTIEDNAIDFVSQVAVPVAERVRDSADDLIDRIGAESRELSEKVGTGSAPRSSTCPPRP